MRKLFNRRPGQLPLFHILKCLFNLIVTMPLIFLTAALSSPVWIPMYVLVTILNIMEKYYGANIFCLIIGHRFFEDSNGDIDCIRCSEDKYIRLKS